MHAGAAVSSGGGPDSKSGGAAHASRYGSIGSVSVSSTASKSQRLPRITGSLSGGDGK